MPNLTRIRSAIQHVQAGRIPIADLTSYPATYSHYHEPIPRAPSSEIQCCRRNIVQKIYISASPTREFTWNIRHSLIDASDRWSVYDPAILIKRTGKGDGERCGSPCYVR